MYAMSAAGLTAVDTTDNPFGERRLHPGMGVPKVRVDDKGRLLCSERSSAVCRAMEIWKLTTGAYLAMGNGGTERVNRTMAQTLSMVVNGRQDGWNK